EKDVVVVKNQTVNLPILALQPDQPPITVEGTPEERIREFSRLAEEAFMRGDLIAPEGNNALYLSNAVLAIDPNDEQSTTRITRIRETVLKQAEAAQQKN